MKMIMHKWIRGRYIPYLNQRTKNKATFFTRGTYNISVRCIVCQWVGYRKIIIDRDLDPKPSNKEKINKQIRNLQHNCPCPKCKKAVVLTHLV